MKDLFGTEIPETKPPKRHHWSSAYAAKPGTGPARETCKTCLHYTIRRLGGSYRKCALTRNTWTGSPASDILAKSPACSKWEGRPKDE